MNARLKRFVKWGETLDGAGIPLNSQLKTAHPFLLHIVGEALATQIEAH
jgi:hypothetical protein